MTSVAEHFCYMCLLDRPITGLSYERFTAISYKFKLSTYIKESDVQVSMHHDKFL